MDVTNAMEDGTFLTSTSYTYMLYVVAGVAAVWICNATCRHNNGKRTVPYASSGMLETIREFSSKSAPFFVLRHARATEKAGKTCFRLALPFPGGMYVLIENNLIQRILKDPTTDKSRIYKPLNQVIGTKENIFTSSNNSHVKMVRKLAAPAFVAVEVSRMNDISARTTNAWCNTAASNFTKNGFSPSYEMVNITFKIICESAFEYHATDEEFKKFAECLELTSYEIFLKQVANPLRGPFGFLIPEVRKARDAGAWLRIFVAKILTTYRSNPNKSNQNTLIKLIDSNDFFSSDKQRIAEMMVFIVAGHDTTGYSVSNCLVLLAKNPEKLTKLREDTKGLSPNEWARRSTYFQYVLKETHRFIPVPALGPARSLGKDFDVGNGEFLPKGSTVVCTQIGPGRSYAVFDDPDTFNPDRWYNATVDMTSSIIPFAVGSRNCIGQALAITQLETILPILLSRFDIQLVKERDLEFFATWKFKNYQLMLKDIA